MNIGSVVRDELLKTILLIIPLLALVVIVNFLVTKILTFGIKDASISFGLILIIVAIVVIATISLARIKLIDQLNKNLGTKIQAFDAFLSSKMTELEKLLRTVEQVKEIIKGERQWLADDSFVERVEKEADEEILVVAPDFYYEYEENYFKIIVDNLTKTGGPTYRYFLPNYPDNRSKWEVLQKKLTRALKEKGVDNLEAVVNERFKVYLLESNEYPQVVLYGLAIYIKKTGEVNCLQYMPRETSYVNINIPVVKNSMSERLVNSSLYLLREISKLKS